MSIASARRREIAQLACVFCLAGCGAEIGGPISGGEDASIMTEPDSIDAAGPADAPPPSDAAPPDAQPCVEGDRQSQDEMTGTCYFLVSELVTWSDARSACQAAGGDLVRIDEAAENDLVFDLATQPDLVAVDLWAGGNDIELEGRWIWLDDADAVIYDVTGEEDLLFEQWREGEPNDSNGEDCMIIEADNPLREWDDRNCTEGEYPYICER